MLLVTKKLLSYKTMEVSVYRSPNSLDSKAVDHLYELLIKTLRQSTAH